MDLHLLHSQNTFFDTMVWTIVADNQIAVACVVDNGKQSDDDLESYLPVAEKNRAVLLVDPVERRHFLFRRCFQRIFVQKFLAFDGRPEELELRHQQDQRPMCLDAPRCRLSFSSSAGAVLAAASHVGEIGVDIERVRPIENAAALAHRFFTEAEAQAIDALPNHQQNMAFLKHWTAKEAGLKAIGKGIVSGLNTFVYAGENGSLTRHGEPQNQSSTLWSVEYPYLLAEHIVAVVHRLPKESET